MENDDFLLAKRFQLLFPEINSNWAEILHGAAQYLYEFPMLYGPTSENAEKIHFFRDELNQQNI